VPTCPVPLTPVTSSTMTHPLRLRFQLVQCQQRCSNISVGIYSDTTNTSVACNRLEHLLQLGSNRTNLSCTRNASNIYIGISYYRNTPTCPVPDTPVTLTLTLTAVCTVTEPTCPLPVTHHYSDPRGFHPSRHSPSHQEGLLHLCSPVPSHQLPQAPSAPARIGWHLTIPKQYE